ncbi:sarcosine oxidase subunit gamma [Pokkaliibacter sp. CJK22405]|uniref:sarcosine oxidase subunit gamma n=1 Tax=Pokkaliibacter sp. CJK22405 TaxID=3384615 RepID=UPI003984C19C
MSEPSVKIAVMEQRGPASLAESPLHHVQLGELAARPGQRGGVTFREHALLGHLVLRGKADNPSLSAAVKSVLGLDLPGEPLSSVANDKATLCWVSPDEWLLLVPGEDAFTVESSLREALQGHFAIVNNSGGQTLIELSGPDAINVLKKSSCYDVHPAHFPVGKCVTTPFAKTTTLLRKTGEESYTLTIRRSFADYAWLWIQDASLEYGLVIAD